LIREIIEEVKSKLHNVEEHIEKVNKAQVDLSETKELEKQD